MKTILVTGGTGFLGSNLCRRLIDDGHRVICVDNNYTGRLSNVSRLLNNPNFKFVNHDICQPLAVDEHLDQIYNLACPASPPAYQGKHSIETTKTCAFGAIAYLIWKGSYNCWSWQKPTGRRFCRLRLRKFTANRWFIRRWKATAATSIPTVSVPVTTKVNAVQRPFLWIITGKTTFVLKLFVSLTRMVHECCRMMEEWFPILWFRHCRIMI